MGKNKLKIKWLLHAVIGFLVMGLGLSMIGDAVVVKMQGADFLDWFIYGTVSLAVFFAGLSFFGQAVVFKSLMTLSDKKNKAS
jgi:hypothetical protein